MFEPSYLALYSSGELKHRADALEARLGCCDICPRNCSVDRLNGEVGFCHSGLLPIVDTVCQHLGEEPPISGTRGSGTVFFGNCNLRCVYCNHALVLYDGLQSPEKFFILFYQFVNTNDPVPVDST